ncbi:hypothetical protein [Metapseudomonas otitidis]|uniref:hypothetical protein n=1 Tax=Metapseudomonas otitidis TaxID=319939 RepID=UPI0020982954|nr:hypothetical protein [Pseudomonas otitidis]MCO7556167.1 hypothetical protein [Pseudomonas otitidis]
MSIESGGPAFPSTKHEKEAAWGELKEVHIAGMSLRDYFAAKAMQALIGTAARPCLLGLEGAEPETSRAAYRIADEMLAARKQPNR